MRLARQLPTITLADAAKLLALMAVDETTDAELYERAAVRWVHRLTIEVRGVGLHHVGVACRALDQLDQHDQALAVLLELCGQRD